MFWINEAKLRKSSQVNLMCKVRMYLVPIKKKLLGANIASDGACKRCC